MIPVTLVVAAGKNGVIGKNNRLPWHLPRDLAYFKQVTMGCPIIMGRKTYESIGKALPGRLNIVVSRNTSYHLPDGLLVNSLPVAITQAKQQQPAAQAIHIIGGATLFEQGLKLANRLYLNRVLACFDGDTYLPHVDWQQWQRLSRVHYVADKQNAYAMDFEIYQKKCSLSA